MAPTKKGTVPWLENLRDAYAVQNVTAMRTELPFFIVQWDGKDGLTWMELGDPRYRLKPFHFETHHGKEPVRDAHYVAALKTAAKSDRPTKRKLFGFWDLFYALPADKQRRTFLYAGQFLRQQPEWETLVASWRLVTGQEPASTNADFVQFVRMALDLPVLEGELLSAVEDFVVLYGEFLAAARAGSRKRAPVREQIDTINRDHFSRLWPISDWVESVISPDKYHLPPWHYDGKLTDWMKEGMGINRLPTTAMALMPLDPRSDAMDPVRTLLRNARLQRECIALARSMPETAAIKLQDFGLSIITSTKRGKRKAQARLELRERAQVFRKFVSERFHVRSVVGIGRTQAAGSPLHESHRDAVLALHMCVQLGKNVLYHDEHGGSDQVRYADLQQAADQLTATLDRESSTELKMASDRYVQLVLRYASERLEVVRGQFLALLFQLLKAVQRRHPIRTDVRDIFADDLTSRLEEARSMDQVIESFNEALQRLSFVSSEDWHGPSLLRIEATLQYLRENFAENLPLPQVARQAGFSVPAFTRAFKQATGTSFLAFLRTIRIEHAKKLLVSTKMTTEQIAQACGFNSQHHLIRSFKKVAGQTPGAYRREHLEMYGK